MNEDLTFAFTVARALIADKTLEELSRLQVLLQTVASLVASELALKRLNGKP